MKTTALLALILSVLGPSSFFGSKKGGSMEPWRWTRADEGQQRTMPERQPERETPSAPSMRPSQDGQMMEGNVWAEDANDEEWQRIERSGERAARRWLTADADRLEQLAEEVQRQSEAELKWLRTIAEKEQATETVKAIDKLLAAQTDRYTKIAEELKEQRKQERAERRTRGRERTERSRRSRSRRTRTGETTEEY